MHVIYTAPNLFCYESIGLHLLGAVVAFQFYPEYAIRRVQECDEGLKFNGVHHLLVTCVEVQQEGYEKCVQNFSKEVFKKETI
jgi:hypothetical protein